MSTLSNTGLQTHELGTAGANSLINANWERLEEIFTPLASATPANHLLFWDSATKKFAIRALSATLTDGATIAWDHSGPDICSVTLAGNRTLANPTNKRAGTFVLKVTQDGTGGRTLAFGSDYRFPGGTEPVLTTAAVAIDILTFVNFGDGILHCAATLNLQA